MTKSIPFFLFFSIHTFVYSNQLIPLDFELKIKFIYEKEEPLISLENRTIFKIKKLVEKRSRTISEWWSDSTPQEWELDNSYFCDTKNWSKLSLISVYQIPDPLFKDYDFVLINESNQQKVFAKQLSLVEMNIPKIGFAEQFFSFPLGESSKISYIEKNQEKLVALENQTIWKINPINYNYRSLWQWMSGEELDQPDPTFIFNLSDWSVLDEIQIYKISDDDISTSHSYKYGRYTCYLMENITKHHLAFIEPFSIQSLIKLLSKNVETAYANGHSAGYFLGYKTGYKDGKEAAFKEASLNQAK